MEEWFYEKKGSSLGPFSVAEMLSHHQSGEIHDNTLVWNAAFADQWRLYSVSGIALKNNASPPPLPASFINNVFAWIFALVPLIGLFIEQLLLINFEAIALGYGLTYIILGYLDARQIERSGRNKKSVSLKFVIWLAPAYLFRRARVLGQKQFLLWIWIAAAAAALAIQNPELIKGDVYLGSGIPPCDAMASTKQVQKIFDKIPLVKSAGVIATAVKNPTELSKRDTARTCQAVIALSNGNAVTVNYVITDQNNQYYYQVEIQP